MIEVCNVTMSEASRTTWHYIMDIHEPDEHWYSLGLIEWLHLYGEDDIDIEVLPYDG